MRFVEENQKGITLITLVVIIIILLILAGIVIMQLTGENGIISKVKEAKEKYTISETKEKLELVITDLRIEQESKGEELTKEDLPKINNDEIDVKSIDNFPVEVICNGQKFEIDENFNVKYIEEANETIVTYTTEPEGYTNQDEIKILIKIRNAKGIKTVEYPKGEDKLICNEQKEVGIDYIVTANGVYTFKIIDSEFKEREKDIVIDKIDKIEPKIPTIEVEEIRNNGFTIVASAEDNEARDGSTKSGIDKYKCYIKKIEDTEYMEYESNNGIFNIIDLDAGTEYEFYVIAFDRAGNINTSESKSSKTTEIEEEIYIDANNGDDENGEGTKEKPFKTLDKVAEDGIITKGVNYKIYLDEGEYILNNAMFELKCDKKIDIYGKKEKTILNVGQIYIGAGEKENYTLRFYRLVWNATSTASNTINTIKSIELYNVVLTSTWTGNGAYYGYFCSKKLLLQNCTSIGNFYVGINNPGGWYNTSYCEAQAINSYGHLYIPYGSYAEEFSDYAPYTTTYRTWYAKNKVDAETYRITDSESNWKDIGTGTDIDGSQADLGVYGGKYSWEIDTLD